MGRSLAARIRRLEERSRGSACKACLGRGGPMQAVFLTEDGATWMDGRPAHVKGDRCAQCARRLKAYAGFDVADV